MDLTTTKGRQEYEVDFKTAVKSSVNPFDDSTG